MSFTMTDLFCGAGGSSTGAISIPGVRIRTAANHWDRAIETHSRNHPDADHIQANLSETDPQYFPRTQLLWASPSCTKHSVAQGKRRQDAQPDLFGDVLPDAAAERSRATMWDVVRFAEYHAYDAVIVENVVDVVFWPPFQAWRMAMESLGYTTQLVFLNSMHAQVFGPGAPQSRDRFYAVFSRSDAPKPDVRRAVSPLAFCPECGPVRAVQSWKRLDRAPWGKYRSQYVYRCPNAKCRFQVLEPEFRPAADIIDWSLTGTRIGDRQKPLAAKTLARIQAGIDKYWAPLLEGRTGKAAAPVAMPARTMPARNETGRAFLTQIRDRVRDLDPAQEPLTTVVADGANHGLVQHAFIAELRGGGSKYRAVSEPLAAVTASGNHHGLVTSYYGKGGTTPTGEALPTCTTVERHALLTPTGGTWRNDPVPTSMPFPARTTRENDALAVGATLDIDDVLFRMLEPREIKRAMDFPTDYVIVGNRREQVRLSGNAVTPPPARDLVGLVIEALSGQPVTLAA